MDYKFCGSFTDVDPSVFNAKNRHFTKLEIGDFIEWYDFDEFGRGIVTELGLIHIPTGKQHGEWNSVRTFVKCRVVDGPDTDTEQEIQVWRFTRRIET